MAAKETNKLASRVSQFPFSLNSWTVQLRDSDVGTKGNTAQTPTSLETSMNWCYCSLQLWIEISKECPTVTAVTGA